MTSIAPIVPGARDPAARPLAQREFIAPGRRFDSIGSEIADIAFTHPMRQRWWLAFAGAMALLGVLFAALIALFVEGVGVWGNNIPVTWALDIVSYDWWIGVACGGLLVSALFLLLGAEWRSALNRITETLALIAAAAAAVYPIIHLGRPWFFYWNLPYPNTLLLYPQFRSPLYWDAIDILSFLVVALSFWYIGLIPDLATLRDRAIARIRQHDKRGLLRARLYGIVALGWRGSALHWYRWTQAYRITALLGIIVVVSLQTGAAVMFAGSVEPGWHDTLLPVAFIAAALFAGVGFIAAASALIRAIFSLEGLITARHLDVLAKLLLLLGIANLYCQAAEIFMTLLGGDDFELAVMHRRIEGPHAWAFWTIAMAGLLPPHLFWFPALRRSALALFVVGLLVALGMFADHFMIIVVTLQHDFLPSASHPYVADGWGIATFAGSVGLFVALMLLALRYLPLVSIVETRRLAGLAQARGARTR
jgi:Ni/Fe-hydrogenase subunit HybB-like protein